MEAHHQIPTNSRNRLKNRLGAKAGVNLAAIAALGSGSNVRVSRNLGDINRRITDLKMEGGTTNNRQTSLADLQVRLQTLANEPRRDSNCTVSTSYGSMKSADFNSSRRSSQASCVSAIRIGTTGPGSFYDPISTGSSRRSSQMSQMSTNSQRFVNLSSQMQGPYSTSNLVVQTQNMSLQVSIYKEAGINDRSFLC